MSDYELGILSGGDDSPQKAVVVPRATLIDGQCSLSIERLILPFLQHDIRGLITVTAPPGGGKTTALRHLQAVLSSSTSIGFFDADRAEAARDAAQSRLAILAVKTIEPTTKVLATFELSPWTIDDCLEYLAARHRDHLAGVLKHLSEDASFDMLKGSPELMTIVMDRMAADPSLTTVFETLRQFVANLDLSKSFRGYLTGVCFDRLGIGCPEALPAKPERLQFTIDQARCCRHEAIQRVFIGEWIAEELSQRGIPGCLNEMAARSVLPEIAASVACRPGAIEMLERLIADNPNNLAVAMAASILLRINPEWRPVCRSPINLTEAMLRSAKWPRLNLESATLGGADFTNGNLEGACLKQVDAIRVQMARANLRDARMDRAKLSYACLAGADLKRAIMTKARLFRADLAGANLTLADLSGSELFEANLQGAILHRAKFCSAFLDRVDVEDADFDHADLAGARLLNVSMYSAKWDHVSFRNAEIRHCNLEGLEMVCADFTRADLCRSLLTGTRITNGKFYKAILAGTGLAEIEWENADLRDADFTHASFHLGSSRSGLVGSTIASEGSRTGFYTDEYYEQDFKSPEEIRKACLCGADLRGAKVENTDFYLVDLRGARYTDAQRQHFARCGAILASRVV